VFKGDKTAVTKNSPPRKAPPRGIEPKGLGIHAAMRGELNKGLAMRNKPPGYRSQRLYTIRCAWRAYTKDPGNRENVTGAKKGLAMHRHVTDTGYEAPNGTPYTVASLYKDPGAGENVTGCRSTL